MLIANPDPTGSLQSLQKAVPPNYQAAGVGSGTVQKTECIGMRLEDTEAVTKVLRENGGLDLSSGLRERGGRRGLET